MSTAGPDEVPEWLRPLAAGIRSADVSRFGRYGAPPDVGTRPAAVLMLFGMGPAGPDVLLIERAEVMRSHAGQPAFPGGAVDGPDTGPVDTALREAAEEVGLDRSGVQVLGLLPALYLPPTGFLVTPVLAWWRRPSPVGVVDPVEVARVERVPVAELVDPRNRCRVQHPSGYVGPAFVVRGMTVWGFTGGLLDWVLTLGGWGVPWNTEDVRPLPQRMVDLAARSADADADDPRPHNGPAADDVLQRPVRDNPSG